MASTATYKCKSCGAPFVARVADRNRGWAKFCSKSCKAIKQTHSHAPARKRHDGISPMKFKVCADCGDPAVNGLHLNGQIEWFCQRHMTENNLHPFDSEALGQW